MKQLTKQTAQDLQMMKGGSYGASGDVQEHYIYDTILAPATIPSEGVVFFQKGMGGAIGAVTKEKYETNMQDSGRLPSGQEFLMKRIKLDLIQYRAPADLDLVNVSQAFADLVKSSYWQIVLPGREFDWEAPGTIFFPSIYEVGNNQVSTSPAVRLGDFNYQSWVTLGSPITIDELVSFKIVWKVGASIAANSAILTTAIALLNAQAAGIRLTIKGTLVRSK